MSRSNCLTTLRHAAPAILGLLLACMPWVSSSAAGPTEDLFVLDYGSQSVLRITPDGVVSVEIDKSQILDATGGPLVWFGSKGIAIDQDGAMYFTEGLSRSVLKYQDGVLSVLATGAQLGMANGTGFAAPAGVTVSSDGRLFVSDDSGTDAVLEVNRATGDTTLHAGTADFVALDGIVTVDLEEGIAAGADGALYVASQGVPNAVFRVDATGGVSLLQSDPGNGSVFGDIDQFAASAAGDGVIVADDLNEVLLHVSPAGESSVFLAEADIAAALGGLVELDGGMAFDGAGNLFVADTGSQRILRRGADGLLSEFVSQDDIRAITSRTPNLTGGMALMPGASEQVAVIDVKPKKDRNRVKPHSKGKVRVAILFTSKASGDPVDFDATQVDPQSVTFGPAGATAHHGRGRIKDVDKDGDMDMVLRFVMRETGLACGDSEVTLAGQTFDGQAFTGVDTIETKGCKEKKLKKRAAKGKAKE